MRITFWCGLGFQDMNTFAPTRDSRQVVVRSERVEIPGLAPFQKSRVFLVDSGLASGGVAVSSGLSELVPLA